MERETGVSGGLGRCPLGERPLGDLRQRDLLNSSMARAAVAASLGLASPVLPGIQRR